MHTPTHHSRWNTVLAMLIICSSLTACGAAAPRSMQESATMAPQAAAPAGEPMAKSASDSAAGNAASVTERMIVRNADISLIVGDVEAQLASIAAIAKKHGGFIVSSSVNRYNGEIGGNTSLRVASDKLDQALADLRALAVEVRSESSSGQDVTGEFVDLQAQLTNLEAAEKQLQKLMEQTTKTEDVLNVFNQLTQIRGQIEQIKGRMKFLSESAALSLINVQLISDAAAQPVAPPAWRPLGTAKIALDSLVELLKGLADFLIYFAIAILPILLIVGVPIVLVVRLIRRAARRRRIDGITGTPPAEPPAN